MAVLDFVKDVNEASEDDKLNLDVFMDLSKAFETIDLNILLDKLYHYRFRSISHAWFSDNLSNRRQYVYYNNTASSYKNSNMWCTPRVNTWPTIIYSNIKKKHL